TQDELARAVGSVREVVARTLGDFASRALIEREHRVIRLLDPAGLHRIAATQPR
ncbi:helix-turn-helix domain-containing protein, partial [Streptomyces griseoaurantiacus]|uniref:helix-turn-helix domain-containing protein n=2 Tax=Streptomyces TaxID=1883 RepID=UPI0034601568